MNLLDIQKLNEGSELIPLIESVLPLSPEAQIFPAKTVPGTSYYTVERTGLPTTGFRSVGEGVTPTSSTFDMRLHEAFVLGGAVSFDRSVASKLKKGVAELEMIETKAVMTSALQTLAKQIWYGTSYDGKGFPGLKAFTPTSSAYVLDAGGSSSATASSIYMVKFGDEGCQIILGNDSAFTLDEFRDQSLFDSNDKQYPGRVSNLAAWVGLQTSAKNCVVRIYNVTADSGKGCTDSLLGTALELFPANYKPDAIFMSRRSRRQLQVSRTVTVMSTGSKIGGTSLGYQGVPTDFEGIPIYATDNILNTDAIGS